MNRYAKTVNGALEKNEKAVLPLTHQFPKCRQRSEVKIFSRFYKANSSLMSVRSCRHLTNLFLTQTKLRERLGSMMTTLSALLRISAGNSNKEKFD